VLLNFVLISAFLTRNHLKENINYFSLRYDVLAVKIPRIEFQSFICEKSLKTILFSSSERLILDRFIIIIRLIKLLSRRLQIIILYTIESYPTMWVLTKWAYLDLVVGEAKVGTPGDKGVV